MKFKVIFFIIICELCFFQNCSTQPWSEIFTGGPVPQLKNHSAVYDPASNTMVVFGGRFANGSNSNELWSLSFANNQWTKLNPAGLIPPPRYTHNSYFDSLNYRMIIWSGQGAELYNDVWAYNISSNTWTRMWQDGNIPGVPLKRYGTGSVFDPVTRNIVTFAGFTTSGRFEDTWTFHVDSLKWLERTNNPHPPKRCLHSACFVIDQRKMTIFGGQDTGPLNDTWSLDLSTFTWTELFPQTIPPNRFFYSFIYTGNGNLAMFGGLGTNPLGDMWKFSYYGNKYETVNQGTNPPAARWGQTAIYIPLSDKMVIFGGEGTANYNDTWQFTNVSTIGIKPTSQIVPQKFSLEQNYPNPFNPKTVISFSIGIPSGHLSVNSFTRLKIYDIIGREIETLINEQLKPGTYDVDFDGKDLSSGVYFYNLKAGNFSETKRMVLVK